MDGSEGPARAIDPRLCPQFLQPDRTCRSRLWDERLSTAAVERELIGMDVSRARRAEVIDEHAAIFILQGALDRLATLRGGPLTMAVVIAALLPVFLLIVLGFVLKRSLMRLETQWHGLERLTYYVLFPMLLIQTLVKADLTKVPVAGVGGALLLVGAADVAAVPRAAAAARALRDRRPGLHLDLPGRDPLADLCGARRLRQSVRRHRAGAGLGRDGRDHPAGQRVQRRRAGALRLAGKAIGPARSSMTVVRNPLIWACVIGLAINVTHLPLPKLWHEVADALGRSSLAIGLLVTGAGLHLEGMFRPSLAASIGRVPQAGR